MMVILPGAVYICRNIFCARKLKNEQTGCLRDDYVEELKNLIGTRWNEVWTVAKAREKEKIKTDML